MIPGHAAGTVIALIDAEIERVESKLRRLSPNQHARRRQHESRLADLRAVREPLDRAERAWVDRIVEKLTAPAEIVEVPVCHHTNEELERMGGCSCNPS